MKVYYFSATGHCRGIAGYFSSTLGVGMTEIGAGRAVTDTAVVVFPVHCQDLPVPVRRWLPTLEAENVALIAVYGRKHPGAALSRGAKLCRGVVIAGAYIPSGHSYLGDMTQLDTDALRPIFERIAHPREVVIPREKSQLFAGIFPAARSRIGVKLIKSEKCASCGECSRRCPMGSMKNGSPGRDCIRCLRCVAECPKASLSFRLHPLLRRYLSRSPREEYKIFL